MKKMLLIFAMALASSYSFASYSDADVDPPVIKKFDTKACKKRCMEELNDTEKCEFICNRDKK